MRDSDYHIVFSPQQYEVFQANGVNSDKLFVYPLPMARHTREFYERINWVYPPQKDSLNKKALVLLSPWEIGVSRDMKIIPNKEFIAKRIKNIRILAEILNQYQIIIKFHPISKDVFKIKKVLESMPFDIKCLELCSNIYEYLAEADVVIELAKGGSTAMYIASLLYPDKFLLSLDMEREFLGDTYRDFEGIVYVDSQEGFIRILESIRDNKFVIPYKGKAKGGIDFSGCTGLFKYLWCQNKALG